MSLWLYAGNDCGVVVMTPTPGTREAWIKARDAAAEEQVNDNCTWAYQSEEYDAQIDAFCLGAEFGHAHAQGEIAEAKSAYNILSRTEEMLRKDLLDQRTSIISENARLTAENTRLQERCERLERALEFSKECVRASAPGHIVTSQNLIIIEALEKGGANE